jgi:hypothetical protein
MQTSFPDFLSPQECDLKSVSDCPLHNSYVLASNVSKVQNQFQNAHHDFLAVDQGNTPQEIFGKNSR